jgi:hypothetical protein
MTPADCVELVGIADAFPGSRRVQFETCQFMWCIAQSEEGARMIVAAGGHRLAMQNLLSDTTEQPVKRMAHLALVNILRQGDAKAKAAVFALDNDLKDKLRRAAAKSPPAHSLTPVQETLSYAALTLRTLEKIEALLL